MESHCKLAYPVKPPLATLLSVGRRLQSAAGVRTSTNRGQPQEQEREAPTGTSLSNTAGRTGYLVMISGPISALGTTVESQGI